MKKIALIIGISGQDGTYLADYLIKKKYIVYGVSRNKKKIRNFKILKQKKKIKIFNTDLLNLKDVEDIFSFTKCNEVYFLSGQPLPSISNKYSFLTIYSNTIPIFNILEQIRKSKKKIKLFNSSSCEIFGDTKKKLKEESEKNPLNIYGLSKLISFNCVKFYRDNYNVFACSAINFHHESVLRGKEFVIPKIIRGAKKIYEKKINHLSMGNLNVIKDWGWAPEYIQLFHKMLCQKKPEDFVIATGKSVKLKYVIKKVFENYKLNWKKYIKVDKNYLRKKDYQSTFANPIKIKKKLNWKPKNKIDKVLSKLINNEIF